MWWCLNPERINDLQQDSIAALVKRCGRAHFVDVRVRINGQWESYQADWIKHLRPTKRPLRSFMSALGRRAARLKATLRSLRRSQDASGAAESQSMARAENTRADRPMPSVSSDRPES